METSIIITGQIGSKFKLRSACTTSDMIEEKKLHHGFELVFKSKKAAVKALSEGYQYLRSDQEDWNNAAGSYQRGFILHYDAGTAKIFNPNRIA